MKKRILIQIILCFTLVAQAQHPKTLDLISERLVPKVTKIQKQSIEKTIQNTTVVSKTVNISAGGLSNALTATEQTTVTDLTITGTIDARDFKTMRDNMSVLAKVDLSGASIMAYTGKKGTDSFVNTVYPQNEIPASAFYNSNPGVGKLSLVSIILPLSAKSIGNYAFVNCIRLSIVNTPSSVTAIGNYAFFNCIGLTNIDIPSTVTFIGRSAFESCSGLTRIYMNSKPMTLSSSTFTGVNTSTCILNVPYLTKTLYAAADYWKSFVNIVEATSGFILDVNSLKLPATVESTTVGITANVAWSASSDQSWLTVSAGSGTGNSTHTINAQTNLSELSRVGTITVSASGIASQTITVLQAGVSKTIALTAGNLETLLSTDQLNSITDLVITGSIDARDFKTMRDNMPMLAKVDLSGVDILAYSGTEGPNSSSTLYPENEIPTYAFYNSNKGGKSSLVTIAMPISTKSIGDYAFPYCIGLSNVTIPTSVTSIGNSAFYGCSGLTNIIFPTSVTSISSYAFYQCSALSNVTIPSSVTYIGSKAFNDCIKLTDITVDSGNLNYSSLAGVLFNKNQTMLVQYPTGKTAGSYTIPSSVTSIGISAFDGCSGLTNIIIPSSVTSIGEYAFRGCRGINNVTIPSSVTSFGFGAFEECSGLTRIYMNSKPMTLSSSTFTGVNTSTCILNVPYKSKILYASADDWKSFVNIVEPTSGFILDINNLNMPVTAKSTTVGITANIAWSATSNQSWLTVSAGSGTGNSTLTINAQTNPSELSRVGIITVSASGVASQTITVLQAGMSKTLAVTAGNLAIALSPDQLNSITDMVITGSIDARDFKTMRDKMPLLVKVNLTGANIVAYTGKEGTSDTSASTVYPENELPVYAFYNSNTGDRSSLVTMDMPASAKSIGNYAFSNCSELTNITILSSVTSIGKSAFEFCKKLSSISIPTSVISIGEEAFCGCSSLPNVSIPSSVTSIGSSAFYQCSALTNVSIPTSVISIGEEAFYGCSSLTNVSIPSSVTSIGSSAFGYCRGLTNVTIPSSVTSIGKFAFIGCSGLTNVIIPSSVTSIGISAFDGCSGLTNIIIPSSVTSIGKYAFSGCRGINNVTIPSSVTSIEDVFYNCSGLTRIYMNSKPIAISSTSFTVLNTSTCILNVPYNTKTLYTTANYWKSFVNIVEPTSGFIVDINSLNMPATAKSTTVGITANMAWTASSNQTWLTVNAGSGTGNSTLTINAQTNLSELSRVGTITVSASGIASQTITVLQAGVSKTIALTAGNLAIALSTDQLNSITDLTITGSIDARDFKTMRDYMPVLAKVDLSGANIVAYTGTEGTYPTIIEYPENEIPEYAFYDIVSIAYGNKSSLVTINMPASTESIGSYAFAECTKLTSITIPTTVISIGDNAFQYCIGLSNVTIPTSVTSIGNYAFYQCSGLTNVTIPSSVTSIGSYAFYQCSALSNVTIPSSVTYIGSYAFKYCSGLTNVSIPSAVNYIGNNVFYECSGLTSVYAFGIIPVDLSSKSNVFYNVNKTTCTLYVPIGSKSAYQSANQWKDFTNIIEFATAVPQIKTLNLSVYPNPFSDYLKVKGFDVSSHLSVYNLQGEELINCSIYPNEDVQVNSLAKGLYLVKIKNNEGEYVTKVVKE